MAPVKKKGTNVLMMFMALVVAMAMVISSCHAIQTAFCMPDPDCETAGCAMGCDPPRVAFCRNDHRMYCCCGDRHQQSSLTVPVNSSSSH
ncbi:hypothetical protein GQ55_8G258600 [Panicum hallii var. hallii]|uniref:Uncharacterized protein n=1 Tax=Panicum hallii var. hallii TaxID=1504633 RepID=A0A2T7CRH0_9POAL|nr:hypothetical protein GQ55_8G258600 [Panicum hallii var. hallii]